jgi:hypothetical protein
MARVAATDDGGLPDLNPSNVGNCIKGTGRQDADLQLQVRGTGRPLEVVFCAAAALISKITTAAKIFSVIYIYEYIYEVQSRTEALLTAAATRFPCAQASPWNQCGQVFASMLTPALSLLASRKRPSRVRAPALGSKFTMNKRWSPYSPEFKTMRRLSASAAIQCGFCLSSNVSRDTLAHMIQVGDVVGRECVCRG